MSPGATQPAPAIDVDHDRRGGRGAFGLRLFHLHAASRRLPAALGAIAVCALGLRVALHWHWDDYGALQLPLVFETGCAAVIGVSTTSPFGAPERTCGARLPLLRLASAVLLIAASAAALTAASAGMHLAAGTAALVRNLAGLVGIALLTAAALGAALSWTAPTAYLVLGCAALYQAWHGTAWTTPWLWPSRPAHDIGAAVCATTALALGLLAITVLGPRERDGP